MDNQIQSSSSFLGVASDLSVLIIMYSIDKSLLMFYQNFQYCKNQISSLIPKKNIQMEILNQLSVHWLIHHLPFQPNNVITFDQFLEKMKTITDKYKHFALEGVIKDFYDSAQEVWEQFEKSIETPNPEQIKHAALEIMAQTLQCKLIPQNKNPKAMVELVPLDSVESSQSNKSHNLSEEEELKQICLSSGDQNNQIEEDIELKIDENNNFGSELVNVAKHFINHKIQVSQKQLIKQMRETQQFITLKEEECINVCQEYSNFLQKFVNVHFPSFEKGQKKFLNYLKRIYSFVSFQKNSANNKSEGQNTEFQDSNLENSNSSIVSSGGNISNKSLQLPQIRIHSSTRMSFLMETRFIAMELPTLLIRNINRFNIWLKENQIIVKTKENLQNLFFMYLNMKKSIAVNGMTTYIKKTNQNYLEALKNYKNKKLKSKQITENAKQNPVNASISFEDQKPDLL